MTARAGAARLFADRAAALADAVSGAVVPTDAGLVDELTALGEIRRLADALGATLAAEVVRRSSGEVDSFLCRRLGERSPAAFVASATRLDPLEAAAWCAVGEATTPTASLTGEPLAPRRPVLAQAVAAGTVPMAAAHRIVRSLDEVARVASAEQVGAFERTLVGYAPHLAPRELRQLCHRVSEWVDPDGTAPHEDLLRSRSGVTIAQQDDGLTRMTVLLHPEAAGFVMTALDARTAPRRQPHFGDAEDDATDASPVEPRTLRQRRLDALVDIARESLTHDSGHVAGLPVTMMVTTTLDSLRTGLGSAWISGIDQPISAATARRLASDAEIIPAVLGSASELLDQGRAQRLATPGQRRALDLRDGGCVWEECLAPPGWTEVAHLRAWVDGGPTDLDNLVLLCPFHHRCLDHDGWSLEWREGLLWLIPPAHVDALRRPRRAGRIPVAA